jgi:protein-disulfide reductase (glutathione)
MSWLSARLPLLLVVGAMLCGLSLADGFNSNAISWVPWEKAVETATRLDKPIMLVVHKTWCAACKMLRQKFVSSPEIEVLSRHFVMADAEDDDEPTDEKYSPQGSYSPRIMFLRSDGSVSEVVNEFSDPAHLHFFGTAEEVVRGMLAALRIISGVNDVNDL